MISKYLKIKYQDKYYFPKALIREGDKKYYLLERFDKSHMVVAVEKVETIQC